MKNSQLKIQTSTVRFYISFYIKSNLKLKELKINCINEARTDFNFKIKN